MDIHIFSLDFSSALLANILHSHLTMDALEKNQKLTKDVMTSLLSLLKENIPTSVPLVASVCLLTQNDSVEFFDV